MKKITISGKIFGVEYDLLFVFWPIALVGIIALFSLIWVVIPFAGNISSRRAQYQKKKTQNEEIYKKITYLSSQDAEELNSNSAKINDAFLPSKDSYVLVGILTRIGNKFGYDLDSFSLSLGEIYTTGKVDNSKKTGEPEKVDAKLLLIGPKDNYYSLVGAVERALPLMKISGLDMKVVGGMAKVELGVTSYYVPDYFEASTKDYSLLDKELSMLKRIGDFEKVDGGVTVVGGEGVDQSLQETRRDNPFRL